MAQEIVAYLWKHRGIVFVVAVLAVLDFAVLAGNFYTSFQIDQDEVAVNLAGRQRDVSQRIARTLWELDADRAAGRPYGPATIEELREAADIFERSQRAFREGGVVPGGDDEPVRLVPVKTRAGEVQDQIESLWNRYFVLIQLLIDKPHFTDEELIATFTFSRANNLRLLSLANDFVTEAQTIGASRASRLRLIQLFGVLLLLTKFGYVALITAPRLLRWQRITTAQEVAAR
jgi:hypothetical protein